MGTPATIEFIVPESNMVDISIIDSLGRTIKDVLHEFMGAGMHRITVELPDLSKSIYFLMIRSEYDNQLIRLNNDVN